MEAIRYADGGPTGVIAYLGTERANDEPSVGFGQRIQRCFELAGYAIVFGDAPEGSRLVHGSWHGPKAERRIRHAWLELPDGLIWEPIRAVIHQADEFRSWARMWDEVSYTKSQAQNACQAFGHYGPWTESRYP